MIDESNRAPDQADASSGAPDKPAREAEADKSLPSPKSSPGKLTPEEQMALFESDLKENDWGHQPC